MSGGYYNYPTPAQYSESFFSSDARSFGVSAPGFGAAQPSAPGSQAPPSLIHSGGYPMSGFNAGYGFSPAAPNSQQNTVQQMPLQNVTANMYGTPPFHGTTLTSFNRPASTGGGAAIAAVQPPSLMGVGNPMGGYYGASQPPLQKLSAVPSNVAALGGGVATSQPQVATPSETSYSGYDVALYAAAKNYLASKATGTSSEWMGAKKSPGAAAFNTNATSPVKRWGGTSSGQGGGRGSFSRRGGAYVGGGGSNYRQPTQTFFCDVCKISCQALQTYNEHLEGKMHKKKEALVKAGPTNVARNKSSFFCAVCEVLCTGADTYQMHVKGSKHVRTVKLHQSMGKPLPTEETKILPPVGGSEPKKVVVVQKVNFVGGEKLASTGISKPIGPTIPPQDHNSSFGEISDPSLDSVAPVGEDYLEMIKMENGKVNAFNCKLCDCRFTDLNAKDMHMRGRRHRLNYKKKVNPDLEVELKPSYGSKLRRSADDKTRRDLMRLRQQDIYSTRALFQSHIEEPVAFGSLVGAMPRTEKAIKRTFDDRYIMAKHDAIYPTNEELNAAQRLIFATEKALKLVSDHFSKMGQIEKTEGQKLAEIEGEDRMLKGVMRVGDMARSLLLKGDFRLELVVLCCDWPTENLLNDVASLLPQKFAECGDENYEAMVDLKEAAILVKPTGESLYELKVIFTSVVVREDVESETSIEKAASGVLDKQKSLEALASLRHAKWFQARCGNLQFGLILLRILKDLRQRIPTWTSLSSWPTELLVEKVLNTNTSAEQPSDALRKFFEAVSSGILMKSGPGLLDPCEKTPFDVLAQLDGQQREDITSSAQHILRLISFGQIFTVLGIEQFPAEMNGSGQGGPRKRPRDSEPVGQGTPHPV